MSFRSRAVPLTLLVLLSPLAVSGQSRTDLAGIERVAARYFAGLGLSKGTGLYHDGAGAAGEGAPGQWVYRTPEHLDSLAAIAGVVLVRDGRPPRCGVDSVAGCISRTLRISTPQVTGPSAGVSVRHFDETVGVHSETWRLRVFRGPDGWSLHSLVETIRTYRVPYPDSTRRPPRPSEPSDRSRPAHRKSWTVPMPPGPQC